MENEIRIIGLSGKLQSGKDTLGGMIQDIMPDQWKIKKFGYKLKQIVAILTGLKVEDLESIDVKNSVLGKEWEWSFGVQTPPTVREVLQKFGTDIMRDRVHTNIWVNALFADMTEQSRGWIVTDVRFPNEVKAIQERGGIVIRVNRPGMEATGSHPSETSLDNYQYWNHVITNEGTLVDLYSKVEDIMQPLLYRATV